MGEKEDKEKAEKLAAAKKRVAQLKKAKQKAAGGEKEKQPTKEAAAEPIEDLASAPSGAETKEIDQDQEPIETEDAGSPQGQASPPADAIPEDGSSSNTTFRPGHGRQPSLSIQSKLRSSSFRRTSTNGPVSPSALKSPDSLPPMAPDNSTITDIYRKQAGRLEELERENKRLEKEASDGEARWRRSEEELEELREANTEAVALRDKVKKGEDAQKEVEKLKADFAALQRQQRGHAMSVSKPMRSPSLGGPESSGSPDAEAKALLSSKDATITDMELEISNLHAQLSNQTSSCTTHGSQIAALTTQLNTSETKTRDLINELGDVKRSLTRASEKAVKEGVERTSSDTKIRSLERDLAAAKAISDDVTKKAETLDKKLEAMNKLHRESEARLQAKLVAAEKESRDLLAVKKKMATLENENSRLKDERERRKRREVSGAGGDDGLDELEDEERLKLEKRIRDLEGENFDLRRGVWRDRRRELQDTDNPGDDTIVTSPPGNGDEDLFDEVDLSGGRNSSRRRSLASQSLLATPQQKHSSFSTVLTSGLAAFSSRPNPQHHPSTNNLLTNDNDELLEEDDEAFDEHAFAYAQREEEARKMVEHVRAVKTNLKEWKSKGWRLDHVEARRAEGGGLAGHGIGGTFGGAGGGWGMAEIFEV